jgi:hypothetical protein
VSDCDVAHGGDAFFGFFAQVSPGRRNSLSSDCRPPAPPGLRAGARDVCAEPQGTEAGRVPVRTMRYFSGPKSD